jgi:uncharacterized protein YndB with AHSA1/START domain
MTTIDDVVQMARFTERSFVHAGDRKAVCLRRTYAFDAETLWCAWTTPERLARWIGEVRGECREGRTVELCMEPPDRDIATLTIVLCEPPRRLVVKWEWPGEPESMVDLQIETIDADHSRLSLEHVALADEPAAGYGSGWEDFLFRLEFWLGGDDPNELRWKHHVEPVIGPEWKAARDAGATSEKWSAAGLADLEARRGEGSQSERERRADCALVRAMIAG